MEAAVWPYAIYAMSALTLTIGLAWTLFNNGKIFLLELFPESPRIAKSINSLLVTGFFMLNLGYALLISRTEEALTRFEATQHLIQQLGILLVSLGVIHFINMAVFWRIRRHLTESASVPVPFTNTVTPPPPAGPAIATFAAATTF